MKKVLFSFLFVFSVISLSAQVDVDNAINLNGANGTRAVKSLELPVNGTDAANKDYVDSHGLTHFIGELYGGGIVVAVWKTSGVEHGLIASLTDLKTSTNSFEMKWTGNADLSSNVPGATSKTNGQANTTAIITQNSTLDRAAMVCEIYTNPETGTGVFSDWYLPAYDELRQCFNAHSIIKMVQPSAAFYEYEGGQDPFFFYWSSTQTTTANQVYTGGFGMWGYNGSVFKDTKNNDFYVRAVRRF